MAKEFKVKHGLIVSGSVGIGVNNPSNKLDVLGSVSASTYYGDGSNLTGITHYTDADTLDYINSIGVVSSSAQLSNQTIPGDLTIGGKLTAQEFHTEFVSASIIYESGSTQFGDTLDDLHSFTGSLSVSGSVAVDGKIALNDGDNNIVIGDGAGASLVSGQAIGNMLIGIQAGASINSGDNNVGNGYRALYANTIGSYNVANGTNTLYNLSSGNNNQAYGTNAGRYLSDGSTALTTANSSLFLGNNTRASANGNSNEIVIGTNAIGNGSNSVTIGASTNELVVMKGRMELNDGGNSVFIGDDAGSSDDGSDNKNVGIGHQALYNNTTGNNNTANGYRALYYNTTGTDNTANGFQALYSNTTGYYNTANGYAALYLNTTGNYNTANGWAALYSNTTGTDNTANGFRALYSNTTGGYNTANGFQALYSNTTGLQNTANGGYALNSNTTGNFNTANGYQALYSNTTGYENLANGAYALRYNTTGYRNTANGYATLYNNTTGGGNAANGFFALLSNTTGGSNVANGVYALNSNTTGNFNTANGYASLYSLSTGSNNIAEGYQAGRYQVGTTNPLTETDNSVFIGTNTKGTLSATNENVFGYGAEGNGSNSVTLGNTSVTKTIINGNLGLGTTSPSNKLDVVGDSEFNGEVRISSNNIHVNDKLLNIVDGGTGKEGIHIRTGQPTIDFQDWNTGGKGEITSDNGNISIQSDVANTKASSNITFSIDASERVRITDTGNVGIGTTSPTSKLDVSGSANFTDGLTVTGSINQIGDLTVDGILTAREFHTEYVSASIIYESGSTKFGDTLDDIHSFTGSLDVSGSVSIDGKIALNDGGNSVYIGDDAGRLDDGTDNQNVGVGHQALYNNTTGNYNVANGYQALRSNTTGYFNTANGFRTLNFNTTGYGNVGNGTYALVYNTTGYYNTANGVEALVYNTTGNNNTANGYRALYYNTIGYENTANGSFALLSNTTGYNNVANGSQALYSLATGSNNTAEGYQAGRYQVGTTDPLTEVDNSLFIGYNTKGTQSATNENVFGYAAEGNGSNSVTIGNTSVTKTIVNGNLGLGTTSPSYKLSIENGTIGSEFDSSGVSNDRIINLTSANTSGLGSFSIYNSNTATVTDFVGKYGYYFNNGASNASKQFQIYVGDSGNPRTVFTAEGRVGIGTTSPTSKLDVSGSVSIDGKIALNDGGNSVYIGDDAGLNDDKSDNQNVGVGHQALYSNTTGNSNIANGYRALFSNTTGCQNVANGTQALYDNTTGYYNTANGINALFANTTGYQNTANGSFALYLNTTGNFNTANGSFALYLNTTGNFNTANGTQALSSNTTGNCNIANGYQALYNNTTGYRNTANGYRALFANTTGTFNVANGQEALYSNTTGVNNTANGNAALYSLATGSNNIGEGYQAGRYQVGTTNPLTEIDNSVFIGYNTKGTLSATNENVFGYAAEGNGSNSVTIGNTSITKTIINGNLGIGTTSPAEKLHVVGNIVATGNITGYYSSDERLKENKKVLKNSIDKINKISGYEFDWKEIPSYGVPKHDVGVIAQEIEEVLPEIVARRDDGYLAVRYEKITPLIIEGIKELSKEVESLKDIIKNNGITE